MAELKQEIYDARGREKGELRKELRTREKRICLEQLTGADVIVATCTVVGNGSILDTLPSGHFDLAIVDEAGQAMEPALYPTLVRCPKKIILAGDPNQLPPTVLSQDPTLSYTLLQELMKKIPENVVMLKTQYRMNQLISGKLEYNDQNRAFLQIGYLSQCTMDSFEQLIQLKIIHCLIWKI